MDDLLQHLVLPSLPNSQDSFHTADADVPPSAPAPNASTKERRSVSPNTGTPCSTASIHTTALQAAGLPVFDINEYLSSPATQAVLDSSPPRKHKASREDRPSIPSTSTRFNPANPPGPVQLGEPKTSHFVSLLNTLCQERRLTPVFEILEGQNGGFGGRLLVGGRTVEREGVWASKKEAREKVAELGTEVVRGLDSAATGVGGGSENWVGRLGEFYAADPSLLAQGPIYTEFALGSLYACECLIDKRADSPFGSKDMGFPSKKAAKTNAAMEAVNWLVEQGELNPDGTAKKRKKLKLGTAVKAQAPSTGGEGKGISFGQRVNDLYPILGLSAPEYRLRPSPQAPNFHSGAAYFPRDPLVVKGPVGEINNVFGKKNAREECAKGVLEFLERLVRERGGEVGQAEM